jgi:primosomal protein N' (replication factor Y)
LACWISALKIARVALDLPLTREFDYLAGDADFPDIGRRVTVSFGSKRRVGILLDLVDSSELVDSRLKPIETLHRETPALGQHCLDFLRFCARYYHHPFGQVLAQVLPPGLRRPQVWKPRQQRAATVATAPVIVPHAPNAGQQAVIDRLGADLDPPRFVATLLQGVTGSGKTEVYLALAQRVIAAGRKVLLLVPEINLTPQLEARVRSHFPGVAVVALHSQLPDAARVRNWLQAGQDSAMVVVGTRLAVLGPLPRLGLVVVDEEHDPSYKQQEGLRYSARDLAVVRARDAGCPVVLGSATPSLESLAQVTRGRYQLLELKERADPRARLPRIELIDLRAFPARDGLSAPATEALAACLARREQSLVFINRRGYAPALWCSECGWTPGCPRCSSRLVVHLRARQARCHLCGWQQPIPARCPECGNSDLRPAGEGTQRVESALRTCFPEARVQRVDADTMSGRGQFDALRQNVLAGEVDIVVGTQMLSKGHDFPGLSCVVVVNADGALFSADFRAGERLMAQLLQVAGRAGRAGLPGTVLVQTAQPAHALFQAVLRQDYAGYARVLLAERRSFGFPPEVHQAVLHASGSDAPAVEAFLVRARAAVAAPAGVDVFDPVPAPLARVAHKYRYQLLVQSSHRQWLHGFLSAWIEVLRGQASGGVQWVLDVDPLEI